jgi:CheY-like chemotaxis protein
MPEQNQNKIALVVDDDAIFRYAIARLIRSYGWSSYEAGGSAEALALCRLHEPRIVLLDLQMPEVDGFETCSLLRSDPLCAGAMIVAVSGLARHSVEERALRAGFDLYLLKPISENLLRALLAGSEQSRAPSDPPDA